MSQKIETPTEPIIDNAPKAQPTERDMIEAVVNGMLKRVKDQSLNDVLQVIAQVGRKPAEQPAPEIEPGDPQAIREKARGGRDVDRAMTYFGQVGDARDRLYVRMDPEIRKYRNPRLDEQHAEWFRALVRNDRETLARFEMMERASLLEGTSTATSGLSPGTAGALIPLPLANLIITTRDREAVLRNRCTIFQSESKTLRVPKLGSATATMVSEGTTAAVGEPASTSVLLDKKKMQFTGKVSIESMMDSAFNLVTILSERVGSIFAQLEDEQICTSSGTAPNITGSIETPNSDSAGAQAVTEYNEASSGVLTYADIVGMLFTSINIQYRSRCTFLGNAGMMRFLSTILDGNDRPIFSAMNDPGRVVADTLPGQVGAMFGLPVVEVASMTAGRLYLMDLKRFGILEGDRLVMRSTDAASWTTDLIDFKVTTRWDGALLDNDAFARISGITSVA